MKVCPNCGRELADNARYCDACGAMCPEETLQSAPTEPEEPQAPEKEEPAAPQPPQDWAPAAQRVPARRGGKKPLIIGAAAAVLAVCVGICLFAGRGEKTPSTPAGQFKAAQLGYLNSLFAASEVSAPAKSGTISTDLTITAQYPDGEIGSYLEGTSIGLQIDVKENAALFGMDFIFKNTPIVTGALTSEKELVGFCVPELSDAWYTMDLKKFIENNAPGEVPDLSGTASPTLSADAVKELCGTFLDTLLTMVTEDNTTVAENTAFPLALTGGSATGTVYTVTPTAQDMETMLLALADQLETNAQLRTILEIYGNMDPSQLTQMTERLPEAAAALRKSAREMAQNEAAHHLTWTLRTSGKKIVSQSISADTYDMSWEGSGDGLYLSASAPGQEFIKFTLTKDSVYLSLNDNDGESVTLTGSFEEKGGKHSGTVNITAGPEEYMLITFRDVELKKTSALGIPRGSYALEMWAGGEETGIFLDVAPGENGGTDHVISFRAPSVSTPEFDLSKLTVTVNSSDKASAVQRPTSPQVDITDYTQEDFEALAQELSNAATGLLFKLMAALYS